MVLYSSPDAKIKLDKLNPVLVYFNLKKGGQQ